MRRHRIQTYRAADGWRSRAHANGRIVADSGEAYRRRIDAHRGARAAHRGARAARRAARRALEA